MTPIRRLETRLESLRANIEGIEAKSNLTDLQGDLYNMVWKNLLPKVNAYDWHNDHSSTCIILKTAKNIVRSLGRKKGKLQQCGDEFLGQIPSEERYMTAEKQCDLNELCRTVAEVINDLDPPQRALVRRRYWQSKRMSPRQRLQLWRLRGRLRNDPRLQAFQEYSRT